MQTLPLSAVCPSCQAGEGTNGRKKSVWSVKYKRELYGRPDLEVAMNCIMTACLGIDKLARSKPFAEGPYKADSIAYYVQL